MLYNYEGGGWGRADSMLKGGSPCWQKLENAVPGGFQVGMLRKDSSSAEWHFSATVINNLVHKVFPLKGREGESLARKHISITKTIQM